MPFLTFLYRLPDLPTPYIGKYISPLFIDEHEGLDLEIKRDVLNVINCDRRTRNEPPLHHIMIGVLSFTTEIMIPIYSSLDEIPAFDLYYEEDDSGRQKAYLRGVPVNLS